VLAHTILSVPSKLREIAQPTQIVARPLPAEPRHTAGGFPARQSDGEEDGGPLWPGGDDNL